MHQEQHAPVAATPAPSTSPAFAGIDHIFTPGRLCVLLGLLMLCRYPGIVLGSDAFFYREAGLFGYPVAYYIKQSIWQGDLPLWNPYSSCGIPFLAQWDTMVLYPGSIIYLLFPMPWSMNVFLLGHIFLAAVGMYHLAYRLFGSRFGATIAGLVFAWNGLTLQCIIWPCNLAALAWMPWVLLLCERAWKNAGRDLVWAALAGGYQMLTGSPEFILFTWMIVWGWFIAEAWVRRRWCWKNTLVICGCAALVAMLSAAQLLPTFDLLRHGDRTSSYGTGTWAISPWGIANFFVPLFKSTPSAIGVWIQDQQQWTTSYYVGLMTLLLAVVAVFKVRGIKTTLLVAVAVFGIVFAMGDSGWVLKVLKATVPLFGVFRYPVKFIVLTVFALPLLAASGVAFIQTGLNRTIIAASGMAIVAIVLAALMSQLIMSSEVRSSIIVNGTARLVFFSIAVAFLILAATAYPRRSRIVSLVCLLLVMGLDVCFHVPNQNPTVIVDAYKRRTPQMKSIPKLGESRAMVSLPVRGLMERTEHPHPLNLYLGQRSVLFGNCNLLDCGTTNSLGYTCLPKVNGWYSLHLKEQTVVNQALGGSRLPVGLAEFLGVSQITSDEHLFAWNTLNGAMPIATAGQMPVFGEEAADVDVLRGFDPRETVLLAQDLRNSVRAIRDEHARVLEQAIKTHEHRYDVYATERTMFVVAQTYSDKWQAFVDGQHVPLLRANAAFQALEIPAGKHFVRLVYRDNTFYTGVALSLFGLIVCAVLLVIHRKDHIDSK